MKVQITTITPHGTFESNWGPGVPKEQIENLKDMLKDCNNLQYLTIENERGTHYIPGNVLKDSMLKVEED